MSDLALLNPIKRNRKRSSRARSSSGQFLSKSNPRHRKSRRRYRVNRNPTSLGEAMRGRRGSVNGFISDTLTPAAVGALGGVLLDTALSYIPLPAELTTPTLEPVTNIAVAAGLGYLAERFAGPRTGSEIAIGAITVTLYELLSSYLGSSSPPAGAVPATTVSGHMGYFMPSSRMGYVAPAYQTGAYVR